MIVAVTCYENLRTKLEKLKTLGIKAAGLPISRVKPKISENKESNGDNNYYQKVVHAFKVKNKGYQSVLITDDVSWASLSIPLTVPIITTSKVSYEYLTAGRFHRPVYLLSPNNFQITQFIQQHKLSPTLHIKATGYQNSLLNKNELMSEHVLCDEFKVKWLTSLEKGTLQEMKSGLYNEGFILFNANEAECFGQLYLKYQPIMKNLPVYSPCSNLSSYLLSNYGFSPISLPSSSDTLYLQKVQNHMASIVDD